MANLVNEWINEAFPVTGAPRAEGAKSKGQAPGKWKNFDSRNFVPLRCARPEWLRAAQALSKAVAGQTLSMKAWCIGIASTQEFTTRLTLAMKPVRSFSGIWSTSGW